MKLKRYRALTGMLLCLPVCFGLIFFYGIPLLLAFQRSLLNGMTGEFAGLHNYIDLLTNSAFRLGIKNTLLFWAAGFPLNLGIGLALALLCETVNAKTIKSLFFFPAMIPAACVSCVAANWLRDRISTAGLGVLLTIYIWKSVGFTVIILGTALHTIPQELIDASANLGANGWQTSIHIKLPLIFPAFGVSLIAAFLNSFRIFREAYLIGGTHPQRQLYSLQHFLYNNFANMNYPRLAAASVILIFIIAIVAYIVMSLLKRKGNL